MCKLPGKIGGYWVTLLRLTARWMLSLVSVWHNLCLDFHALAPMGMMGRGSTKPYRWIQGECRNFGAGTVRLGTSCHDKPSALPQVLSRDLLLEQGALQGTWHPGRHSFGVSILLSLNRLLWLTVSFWTYMSSFRSLLRYNPASWMALAGSKQILRVPLGTAGALADKPQNCCGIQGALSGIGHAGRLSASTQPWEGPWHHDSERGKEGASSALAAPWLWVRGNGGAE